MEAVPEGDVLVVGEALVDVVRRPDGGVDEYPGGSPANVALALARLGRPTQLLTHIGDDARGVLVRNHLAASGVQLVEGSVTSAPTSTAVATLDASGGATYTFDLEWSLPRTPLPANPLAVHTGSIAAVLQPGAATVERILRGARGNATTSYDPNLRPQLMGSPTDVRPHVESLVASSDIVKLSEEDATWLAPEMHPFELLERWLGLGPAIVVLTRGGDGLTAVCRDGRVSVPSEPVRVVDTVGAGDTATAGLLDALWSAGLLGGAARERLAAIDPADLQDVLAHAARVAAVTVSRAGANPPTRAELDAGPA
ncbi:MAG: carbohydrate kinase family protein [Actinomycetes bacterium]